MMQCMIHMIIGIELPFMDAFCMHRECVCNIIIYLASGWEINAQPLEKLIIWGRAVTSDPAHFAQLNKSTLIHCLWVN